MLEMFKRISHLVLSTSVFSLQGVMQDPASNIFAVTLILTKTKEDRTMVRMKHLLCTLLLCAVPAEGNPLT